MKSFYIFILFIFLGVVGFLLSFLLNKISFFYEHENLTFILICFICSLIYGIIINKLLKKK